MEGLRGEELNRLSHDTHSVLPSTLAESHLVPVSCRGLPVAGCRQQSKASTLKARFVCLRYDQVSSGISVAFSARWGCFVQDSLWYMKNRFCTAIIKETRYKQG